MASGMSWVCVDENTELVGYALVHEIANPRNPPHLDQVPSPAAWGGCHLFIHDVCVSPKNRAQGIGKELVRHVLDAASAARYETITLVSLEASVWFWIQFGFQTFGHAHEWNYRREYGEGSMLLLYTGYTGGGTCPRRVSGRPSVRP